MPGLRTELPLTGKIGLGVLLALLLAATFGPYFTPDAYDQNLARSLEGPSAAHWLGTDQIGRDLLARILVGARYSLLIGIGATFFGVVIGVSIGAVSGYFGGIFEAAAMRFMDLLMVFPGILIALMVIAVAGDGLGNVIFAVGLRAVPVFARLAQTSTHSIRAREYIVAARAAGASGIRILWSHVLPALLNSLVVLAALQVATSILIGATLSFLGVGLSPEMPEWGAMLNSGRRYIFQHWPLVVFPGLAIMITVLGINLLGDGLRSAADRRRDRGVALA
ncbi:MAG: ABC transporter permease [Bradyrhizobiaceae bacterium]|nr:ABC transporter permease [Bradyrhizobiaceae bacterium]